MGVTTTSRQPSIKQRASAWRSLKNRRALAGIAFVTPAILFLMVFVLGPFLFTVYVSFHQWNMLSPVTEMPFRGLDNYRYLLLEDPLFWQTARNTVVFALGNVTISCLMALAVALTLNGPVRMRTVWRTIYFLPYVTSMVAISIVWANLYHSSYGLINGILELFGLPPLRFLASLELALPSVIVVGIWHGVGYYMLIFLAGLQAIPAELYEAAKLDGANAWNELRSITLPLLKPTILFVVVINTLISLQMFDLPFILTGGGPVNATNMLVLYMYQTAFEFSRMGRATAMAVLLFLVILIVTLVQLYLLRTEE